MGLNTPIFSPSEHAVVIKFMKTPVDADKY